MLSPATYSIDFTKGTLRQGWPLWWLPASFLFNPHGMGEMQYGISAAHDRPEHRFEDGLRLAIYRGPGSVHPASGGVYVLPKKPISLNTPTHFELQLRFDLPDAQEYYSAQQPETWFEKNPRSAYVPTPNNPPEPWAVSLNAKVGDANDYEPEPRVGATCRFDPDGIRLNVSDRVKLPGEKAADFLITPPAYSYFAPQGDTPPVFTLSLAFDVIPPAKIATGKASLSLERNSGSAELAFTHNAFASATRDVPAITALGAGVVSARGEGQMMARFLNFSLSISPVEGVYTGN